METRCDNCIKEYDRMNIHCAYCVVNTEKRVSHFIAKKPLLHEIDFGGIDIHNFDDLISMGWGWSIEEMGNSRFRLVIYLHNITLTEMGEYDEVKERIIKNYNLPVGLCS